MHVDFSRSKDSTGILQSIFSTNSKGRRDQEGLEEAMKTISKTRLHQETITIPYIRASLLLRKVKFAFLLKTKM